MPAHHAQSRPVVVANARHSPLWLRFAPGPGGPGLRQAQTVLRTVYVRAQPRPDAFRARGSVAPEKLSGSEWSVWNALLTCWASSRIKCRTNVCCSGQRTHPVDPLLPATVFTTADRRTLKADIDRHPGAATKFRELSFDAPCRRWASVAGRTTADQRLELALPTLSCPTFG